MRGRRRLLSRRRRVALIGVAAIAALALASCSSRGAPQATPVPTPTGIDVSQIDVDSETDNGLQHLDGAAALDVIVQATRSARWSVMEGTLTETIPVENGTPLPGRLVTLAVSGSRSSFTADITAGAQQVSIVVTGGRAYLSGNAAYAARVGVEELAEGYVCTSADDPLVAEWRELLSPASVLDTALSGGELSVTPPASAEATTTELVIGSGNAPVGALTVPTVGAPLPSALVVADPTGAISLAFSGWGEAQKIPAPAGISVPCG